ncbi:MAG: exo-alpha-sialidase [Nitrospira sp.]|nr:exo-alpha-sialidase [Nitrospira sp.]
MYRILSFVLLLVFVFALSARAGEKTITSEPFNRYKPISIKESDGKNIWTAYYDLRGGIHIKNIFNDKDIVVNEGREGIAAGLAFDVQGDNAFVVWREKIGGQKKLWFRASHDGGRTLSEPLLLDEESQALTRIKIGSNSKGDVFVLWYGEKPLKDSRHNFYCVASNDFGKTFSKAKNLTIGYDNSIYPTLLVDEVGAYIFSYSRKDGKKYMIFRKTIDRGKTWSNPLEIKEIGVVTLFIEPIKVGNRLHVFWFNTYDGDPVIEGAFSDDEGKTWKTTILAETKGLDIGLLKVTHDNNGHIFLSFSGKWNEDEKNRVYLIRSEDNGNTWEKLTSVRHYPFTHTHAENPEIMARDNGEAVVVWVDYRNIRSNLYMQYSKDYGRTWQERDIPLEDPGRFNTAHYPYTDSLVKIKDSYYVLAYRFEGDLTLGEADLLLLDFKIEGRGAR